MTGTTGRYGLTTLNDGDELSALDYRFGTQDRHLLDRLLQHAVEGHVHTGAVAPGVSAIDGLRLNVQAVGGIFPAGKTIYYRFGVVDPRGQEYVATAIHAAVTPQAIFTPSPVVSLTPDPGHGSLVPGDYSYALSAYTDVTGSETLASRTLSATLPQGGSWTLALPAPPSGATGWNIYRRSPGDLEMVFLTTALVEDLYVDDGAVRQGLRPLPSVNTTRSTSSVQINFAQGVPEGHSVRIYRTLDQSDWTRSLVGWASGTDVFVDTGHATQVGMPLARSTAVGGPPKIRWVENTEGIPPPGLFTTARMVTFNLAGPVTVGLSPWQWINEYDVAELWLLRATLGRGSVPANDPVIAAIQVRRSWDTEWKGIYTYEGGEVRASIYPGTSTGSISLHDGSYSNTRLGTGDALRAVVHQSGGGATPTDENLSLVVTMFVSYGSQTSYVWKED